MHVLLTLAIQSLVVNINQLIVLMEINVPLIDATRIKDVSTALLFVMTKIHAQLILATSKKDVFIEKRNAMITMHVLEIGVVRRPENVFIKQEIVMTTMHVPKTLAILKEVVLTNKLVVMMEMLVLLTLVTKRKDANTLLSNAMTKINAPSILAT
jgi:hypothetical protein